MDIQKRIILSYRFNALSAEGQLPRFYLALKKGDIAEVSTLLEKGIDIEQFDNEGRTPLHLAVKLDAFSMAKTLIQQGANLNAQDIRGLTPLHLAILNRNFFIVTLLLEKGADTQTCDTQVPAFFEMGVSSLNESVLEKEAENSFSILSALIKIGIDTHQKDQDLVKNIIKKYQKYQSDLQLYRAVLGFKARLKLYDIPSIFDKKWLRLHPAKEISHDEVRCFLYTYFKIRSWSHHLLSLPTILQQEISQLPTQDEALQRIFQLEIQFKLLSHLKNSLNSYDPEYQLGSDIPFAFKCLTSTQNSRNQMSLLYENFSKRYKKLASSSCIPKETKERIIKQMLGSRKIEEILLDDFGRLLFFDYYRVYPIKKTNQQFFIQKWQAILAKYVEKTLPEDLKKAFKTNYVDIVSSMLELDTFLADWSYQKPFNQKAQHDNNKDHMNVHLPMYSLFLSSRV